MQSFSIFSRTTKFVFAAVFGISLTISAHAATKYTTMTDLKGGSDTSHSSETSWGNVFGNGGGISNGTLTVKFKAGNWGTFDGLSVTIGRMGVLTANYATSGDKNCQLNIKGGATMTIDGGTFVNNNNRTKTYGNMIASDGSDGTMRIINGGVFKSPNIHVELGAKQGSTGTLSVDNGTVEVGGATGSKWLTVGGTRAEESSASTYGGTGILAMTNATLIAESVVLGSAYKYANKADGDNKYTAKVSFKDTKITTQRFYSLNKVKSDSFVIFDGATVNTAANDKDVLAALAVDYTLEGKGLTVNAQHTGLTVGGSFTGTAPFIKQGAETLTFNGSFKNAATFQVDEGVLALGAINQNFAKTGEGELVLNDFSSGKGLELKEGQVTLAWSGTAGTNPFSTANDANSIAGVLDFGGAKQTLAGNVQNNSGIFRNGGEVRHGEIEVDPSSWLNLNGITDFTVGEGANVYFKRYDTNTDGTRNRGQLNMYNAYLRIVGEDARFAVMNERTTQDGTEYNSYGKIGSSGDATVEVGDGGTFAHEKRGLILGWNSDRMGAIVGDGGNVTVGGKELFIGYNGAAMLALTNSTLTAKYVNLGWSKQTPGKQTIEFVGGTTVKVAGFKKNAVHAESSILFDDTTWEVTGSESTILPDLGCTITIGEGGLTIDTDHDVTISAIISGPGKITKKGTGTLTIQGAQQFTGGIVFAEDGEEPVGGIVLAAGASLPVGSTTGEDVEKISTPIWYKLQVNPDTQRLEVVDAPETTWLGEDDGLWSEGANWSVGAPPIAKSVTIFEATETKDHGTTVYDLTNNKIPSEINVNSGAWTTKVDQASFSDAKLKVASGAEFALDSADGKSNPFATTGNEIHGTLDLGKATQQFEGTSSFKEGSIIKNGNVNLNFDGWMTLDNLSLTLGTNAVVQTLQAADNTYGELNIRNGSIFTIDGGTFVDKNKRSKNGNNIGNDYGVGTMRIINGGQFESPNIRVQVGAQTQKGREATIGILSVDKGTVKIGGDSANQQLTVGGNRTDQQAAATGIVAMTNGVLSAYSVMLGDGIDGNIAQLTFKDSEIDVRKIYRSKKLGDGSFVKFDGATFNTQINGEILGALGTAYRLIGNGLTINAMHEVTSSGALNCQGPLVKTGTGTLTLGNQLTVNPDLIVREGTLAFNLESADKIPSAATSITLEGEGKVSGLPAATYKKLTIGEGAMVDESSFPNGKLTFSEIEVPEGVIASVATPIGADFAKTGAGELVLTDCSSGKALNLQEGKVTLAWSDAAEKDPFSTAGEAVAIAGVLDLGGATQTILVATPDNVLQDGFTLLNGTLNANFTGWWSMNGGRTVTIGPGATLNTGVGTASGRDKYNREGELNIRQGSVIVVDGGTLNANNDRDDSTNGNDIGNDYNADADNTATLRVINGGIFNSTANFVELGVKQGVTGILAVSNGTVNIANGDKWLSVAPGREGAATTGIVAMTNGVLIAQTIVLCDASADNTAKLTFKDSEITTQRIYAKNTTSSDSFVIFDSATWNVAGSRSDILTDLGCPITIGEGGLTIDTDHDVTISAILSGSGKIVKKGAGVLTLEGAQEFTGGIEFAEGAEKTVALTETTTIAGGITEENFENFIVPEGMMLFVRSDGSIGVRKEGASVWTGGASSDAWSKSGNWDGGVPNGAAIFTGPGKQGHTTYNLGPTAVTNIVVESGDWTTDVGTKCFREVALDLRSGASFALENAASRTNLFSTAANANVIAGALDLGGATQTFAGALPGNGGGTIRDGATVLNGTLTLDIPTDNSDNSTWWCWLKNTAFTVGTGAHVIVAGNDDRKGQLNFGGTTLTIDNGTFESLNTRSAGSYIGNDGLAASIIVRNSGKLIHTKNKLYLGYGGTNGGAAQLIGESGASIDLGNKELILGCMNGAGGSLALTNSSISCGYISFASGTSDKPGKQVVDLKNTIVKFPGFEVEKVNGSSSVKLDGVTFVDKGSHITLFPATMPTCEIGPDGILVQGKRGSNHASISINSAFTGTGGMTIETPDSDFSVSLGGTPDFTGDFVFKGPGKLALSEGKAFHGNVILANGAGFKDYDPNGDQEIDEAKAVLTTTGTITYDLIGQKILGKRNRFFTKTKDGVTTLYFGPKPTGMIIFNGQN